MVTKALEELCQMERIKKLKTLPDNISPEENFVLAERLEVERGKVIYSEISHFAIEEIDKERWLNWAINTEDIVIFINKKKIQIGINVGDAFWSSKASLIRLRCNKDFVSPFFMNYLLEHKKEELEDLFDDSIDRFFEDLKQFKLTIPDLKRQSEIISSLEQFYKLINGLKQQLKIREQQFQLFQEKLFSANPN